MRILLDENIDRLLKPLFDPAFEVVTVHERGWNSMQNGDLLRAAEDSFDVFVTMDGNLPHQQNLKVLNLAVVVLRARSNAFTHTAPVMPKVNEAVREAKSGEATVVTA